MAGRVGKIGDFDATLEEWGNYMERVTHYSAANRIEADKQKDTFLCCIGRDTCTFGLLRTLVAPAKPREKTYKELVDALTAHLAPKQRQQHTERTEGSSQNGENGGETCWQHGQIGVRG